MGTFSAMLLSTPRPAKNASHSSGTWTRPSGWLGLASSSSKDAPLHFNCMHILDPTISAVFFPMSFEDDETLGLKATELRVEDRFPQCDFIHYMCTTICAQDIFERSTLLYLHPHDSQANLQALWAMVCRHMPTWRFTPVAILMSLLIRSVLPSALALTHRSLASVGVLVRERPTA